MVGPLLVAYFGAACAMAGRLESAAAPKRSSRPGAAISLKASIGGSGPIKIVLKPYSQQGHLNADGWGSDHIQLTFYKRRQGTWSKVSSYSEESAYPNYLHARLARYKGTCLLAVDGNGGQYNFVTVYRLEPKTLQPKQTC